MILTKNIPVQKVKNEAHRIYINTLSPNFKYINKYGKLGIVAKNCVNL